ncbi:fumarylacetoacetate hydrolase family protein [Virgibacillus kekensis]|uniref:Fumarylacetoacetate hydrolase family protein n=1 Tax=Virgibacillus kekensis TaxID=202261 RepID=A0ABV9DIL4_9BACI
MKLVSYKYKGKPGSLRVGFMNGERIVDVQEAYRQHLLSRGEKDFAYNLKHIMPADPDSFFSAGNQVIASAGEVYKNAGELNLEEISLTREEVYLSTPIPNPSKIICVGKNYAEHAAEMKSDIPDYPVLFAKFANSLIGPEDSIMKSDATQKLDYEVELGLVIGKEASGVKREEALEYLAGYTIGNDISARDLQKRTPQWLQGKTLDKSTPVGPWVVTPDEVGDSGKLSIRSVVNGQERQAANTDQLIFDVPFLIEFISNLITLNPGDIILTGTPNGVGFAMDPPQFLTDGDTVTLEIDKIGRMENRVEAKGRP